MSVLVVADGWPGLDPSTDALVAVVAEAQDRGIAVRVCGPGDLLAADGRVRALARPATLGPRWRGPDRRWSWSTPWQHLGLAQEVDVTAPQAVLVRRSRSDRAALDLLVAAGASRVALVDPEERSRSAVELLRCLVRLGTTSRDAATTLPALAAPAPAEPAR